MLLNVGGFDTVAKVFFNDLLVLKTYNQFIPSLIPLKQWKIGKNYLRIEFKSPVNYAKQKSEEYQVRYHKLHAVTYQFNHIFDRLINF